jgi:hypothetical protein
VKIAFDDDSKCADGRKRAALGAVDLVEAVAVAYRLSVTSARKVKILRERLTRVLVTVSLTCGATAPEATVPGVAATSVIVTSLVPVPQ